MDIAWGDAWNRSNKTIRTTFERELGSVSEAFRAMVFQVILAVVSEPFYNSVSGLPENAVPYQNVLQGQRDRTMPMGTTERRCLRNGQSIK